MQCTISGKALECAVLAAPNDDVRYYLNGVLIEWNEEKTRVVVTNGHYMYLDEREPSYEKNVGSCALIVPREVLAKLKVKAWSKTRENAYILTAERVSVQEGVESFECTIREVGENTITSFRNTIGRFPDYRKAVPHFASWDLTYYPSASDDNHKVYYSPDIHGQPRITCHRTLAARMLTSFECRETIASYDFDYLTMAMKIHRIHANKKDCKSPRLFQNGDKGGLIRFTDSAYLVIMPMRQDIVHPPVLEQFKSNLYTYEEKMIDNGQVGEN